MSLIDQIDSDNVRQIVQTKFGIMSPQKIIAQSVAHIYNHIGKQKGDNSNTLLDPKLGASRGQVNSITGLSQKFDPGNFGHCVLAKPVYHPMFYSFIKRAVSSVCIVCSCPRFASEEQKTEFISDYKNKPYNIRYAQVTEKLSGRDFKNCIRCGAVLPAIRDSKEDYTVIGLQAVFKNKDKDADTKDSRKDLNPEQVYRILKNISDDDSELLGFNPTTSRPDWMMITVLPIPPPSIRPSVQVENGKVSEDDLTHAFNNIIKHNNTLSLMLARADISERNKGDGGINKCWQALQWMVAAMIDNETSAYQTATNRTHRPLKTIRKRHRGKQGRIRWNLMGKRVNLSARSVITADPNLGINQVGIPEVIAKNLTFPENVTKYNIEHLNRLVANGPDVYPGAKHYRPQNSKFRKDLYVNRDVILLPGDIVYRHILDGDIVFFNRQPSLHKMSMMAHHAKVMPGLSFRLNPNDTTPYNADFDGDEMNLHLPQTVICAEEISRLAMVSTQVVSPQAYKPCIGLVQDSLLGTYRMSSETVRGFPNNKRYYMNPRQFMRLSVWLNNYVGKMPLPTRISADQIGWTSRQLLNMFMPQISMKSDDLTIKNGLIIEPEIGKPIVPIGKKIVGKGAGGGLIHITWSDLGPSATRDLLDNFSRLSSQWLLQDGFSVGLSDVELSQKTHDEIEEYKVKYLEEASQLIEGLHLGKYDEVRNKIIKQPKGLAKNDYEQFEVDIMYHLGVCKSKIETLTVDKLTDVRPDNRIKSMVDSGSKGSSANVVQIGAAVCQQDIGGKRIANSYMRRPFPHVPKDDLSPETRGFCRNSFIAGLSPIEYITHAMAGRIGVISTSIKTAETGYIQRKLVKVLEDVMIAYDGTVRNAANIIIQHLYGGDGFDGSKIEHQKLDHMTMANDEFEITYRYSDADMENLKTILSSEAYAEFESSRAEHESAIKAETDQIRKDRYMLRSIYKYNIPKSFLSPINFNRLIKHTSFRLGINNMLPSDLTPKYIISEVTKTIEGLRVSANEAVNRECTHIISVLMRSCLHSKKLIFGEKFTKEALTYLLTNIKVKFNDALITPGEAVGPIAAQSIGEPSTQMTLDTFHHAGIGAKANVSRGVPRLKEIMSLATKPKTPSIITYLNPNVIRQIHVARPTPTPSLNSGEKTTIGKLDEELREIYTSAPTLDEATKTLLKTQKESMQHSIITAIKKIKSEYDYVTFKDIVRKIEVVHDEDDRHSIIENDQGFLDAYWDVCRATSGDDLKSSPWILRFELDSHKLADHNIELYQIEYAFNTDQDIRSKVHCIFSDDNSKNVVCRARINSDSIGNNPTMIIDRLESFMLNKKIKGVPGISKTSIRIEKADLRTDAGAIISQYDSNYTDASLATLFSEEYVIDTVGSNMLEVLNMPYVDTIRTVSNNIYEIFDIYGIEGARQVIINEIMEVMDYAGASIGRRHVELLADIMTSRGILQSVDRFGVKKGETGPWARASFEETTPHMIAAAAFSEVDNMKGVSANVMFGQFTRVGTNSFTIGLDESLINKLDAIKETEDEDDEIMELATSNYCTDENLEFKFEFA